jgi:hypothetical protein
MAFLADNGIVHCDLAARNVLVVKEGGGFKGKVNDFGLARRVYASAAYYKGSYTGHESTPLPVKWTAPVSVC